MSDLCKKKVEGCQDRKLWKKKIMMANRSYCERCLVSKEKAGSLVARLKRFVLVEFYMLILDGFYVVLFVL